MNGTENMGDAVLSYLAKEEIFGDEDGKGSGFSITGRHANPYMFGPKSFSKIKFRRGIRIPLPKLRRIGELIADGKDDYTVAKIISDEFPGKAPGWRIITKVRTIVEADRGPFMCKCGFRVNHVEDCPFKTPRVKRNRGLSVEAVRHMRQNYGPEWTLIKLAHKWRCSESAVHAVVLGKSHQCPPLKLAQYKTRLWVAQLEKLINPVERFYEWRTVSDPPPGSESEFNAHLVRARQHLHDALEAFSEATRVK